MNASIRNLDLLRRRWAVERDAEVRRRLPEKKNVICPGFCGFVCRLHCVRQCAALTPLVEVQAEVAPAAAASRSLSANTMFGLLPPSSRLIRFSVRGRFAHDDLADFGRTGEGHLVDIGMLHQRARRPSGRSREPR